MQSASANSTKDRRDCLSVSLPDNHQVLAAFVSAIVVVKRTQRLLLLHGTYMVIWVAQNLGEYQNCSSKA